jgi:hypothetical protein
MIAWYFSVGISKSHKSEGMRIRHWKYCWALMYNARNLN